MPNNPCGAYFCGMKAPGRALALDLSLAVIGVVLTAVAVWSVNVIATPFAGPTWLKVIWPLLIGAPLALRRRAPLLGWTIIWAGISLQALITGNSPEGLELMFVLGIGSYSVAAYSTAAPGAGRAGGHRRGLPHLRPGEPRHHERQHGQ